MNDAQAEFEELRDESLQVPCTYCKAIVGEVCINLVNQSQLEKVPAHMYRLWDAAESVTE